MGSVFDVVGLLDEVYAPGRAPAAWLSAVAAAAAPGLGQGGAVTCHYIDLGAQAAAGDNGDATGGPAQAAERGLLAPGQLGMPLFYVDKSGARRPCGFLSDFPDGALQEAMRPLLEREGAGDALGVSGLDAAGRGCLLVAFVPRGARPRPIDRLLWARLGAHLCAGLRLCLSPPGAAEVAFGPHGQLLEAVGAAGEIAAQRALCEAAARQLQARSMAPREDARAITDLWRPLVAGCWTLRREITQAGEARLLGYANAPAVQGDAAGLVRGAAALGHDLALIAYETGLPAPAVRLLLAPAG